MAYDDEDDDLGSEDELQRARSPQPFRKFIPSLLTIGGLCFGLSAIRFAMLGRWEICVGFIFAAALFDGLDGRTARLLKATSNFGAQLDSLSDFVCFGVAPVVVLYMWQLETLKRFGWAAVLFYAVCAALRLARFNTALIEDKPQHTWQKRFFVGIPSPAAGLLVLVPLMMAIETGMEWIAPAWLMALYVVVLGVLMVSRIPTFAAKNARIPARFVVPMMLLCAFTVVFLVIEPWKTLCFIGVIYLCSIPFSYMYYQKLLRGMS